MSWCLDTDTTTEITQINANSGEILVKQLKWSSLFEKLSLDAKINRQMGLYHLPWQYFLDGDWSAFPRFCLCPNLCSLYMAAGRYVCQTIPSSLQRIERWNMTP